MKTIQIAAVGVRASTHHDYWEAIYALTDTGRIFVLYVDRSGDSEREKWREVPPVPGTVATEYPQLSVVQPGHCPHCRIPVSHEFPTDFGDHESNCYFRNMVPPPHRKAVRTKGQREAYERARTVTGNGPPTVRRAERERIAKSIAQWLDAKARYFSDSDSAAIRMCASDLANGEWDEDTLGGTVEGKP